MNSRKKSRTNSRTNSRKKSRTNSRKNSTSLGAVNEAIELAEANELAEENELAEANELASNEEEEEENINFGIILRQKPRADPILDELELVGPNSEGPNSTYAGPSRLIKTMKQKNPKKVRIRSVSNHDFRDDPPLGMVIGKGTSKTVWYIPGAEGTGPRVIVNAQKSQYQHRENAKEEYNYTKILNKKYSLFPVVSEIPHLVGKKFKKFVYFSEIAQKVPFETRADGENYLRSALKLFKTLYEIPGEHFMVLIDIKPDNFGIVDRGDGPTLIWLDIGTREIMAVRKRLEAKHKFFMKYQQLLLLLTFFLHTKCPEKSELCRSIASELGITKYDLYRVFNYVFPHKDVTDLAGYHQRFLLSLGLNRSANAIARAVHYKYFMPPPYYLIYYLHSYYKVIEDLLFPVSPGENVEPEKTELEKIVDSGKTDELEGFFESTYERLKGIREAFMSRFFKRNSDPF